MRKTNKYIYLYIIQGNYGDGWEDLTAEEEYREARARLREYYEDEPRTLLQIIKRRELNPKYEFKIGDVVAHHEKKTIGIVRSEPKQGALRTDADGMVDVKQLSLYDRTIHTDYHIAPSTKKELNL